MGYVMQTQTPGQQSRGYKVKNPGVRHLLAFAKAWNAWRTQTPVASIKIRDDDTVVEFL
jgi:hypothetical protein